MIQTAMFQPPPDDDRRREMQAEAREARAKGMAKALSRKGVEAWKEKCYQAIKLCALNMAEFTTDDVWAQIGPPPEKRISGPIMTACARRGWIENTGRVVASREKVCHARPKAVWRSLILSSASL